MGIATAILSRGGSDGQLTQGRSDGYLTQGSSDGHLTQGCSVSHITQGCSVSHLTQERSDGHPTQEHSDDPADLAAAGAWTDKEVQQGTRMVIILRKHWPEGPNTGGTENLRYATNLTCTGMKNEHTNDDLYSATTDSSYILLNT